MNQDVGNIIYRKQATGKLMFKRTGEAAFIDLGNVRMFKYAPNVERTKTSMARKGYVQIVDERPSSIEHRWTVGLDEELPDLTRLQLLAGTGTEQTQAAITSAATMSISASKKGQVIVVGYDASTAPFGIQDLNTVTVTDTTPTTYVEGVDYTLDAKAGLITILPTGSIVDETALTISYKAATLKTLEHKTTTELTVSGTAVFDEYDQHDELPRARYTFAAQIISSNRGDNDGKKQSEFEVELLATGQITRRGRDYPAVA